MGRQIEHNADVYGLEVTHDINANPQESAAHAFQVLGELLCLIPTRARWWFSGITITRPFPTVCALPTRYDPWGKGEQPKYVK